MGSLYTAEDDLYIAQHIKTDGLDRVAAALGRTRFAVAIRVRRQKTNKVEAKRIRLDRINKKHECKVRAAELERHRSETVAAIRKALDLYCAARDRMAKSRDFGPARSAMMFRLASATELMVRHGSMIRHAGRIWKIDTCGELMSIRQGLTYGAR